jgi:hypothetical protein
VVEWSQALSRGSSAVRPRAAKKRAVVWPVGATGSSECKGQTQGKSDDSAQTHQRARRVTVLYSAAAECGDEGRQ